MNRFGESDAIFTATLYFSQNAEKSAYIVEREKQYLLLFFLFFFLMKESKFQRDLIKKIKEELPGCLILKNDSGYVQGIPDLTVFYNSKWAMLECKKEESAHHQPNQEYYVNLADSMSFARFVYPENREETLNELKKWLQT